MVFDYGYASTYAGGSGIITFLSRFGFIDVIIPFLLIFTILYAVLRKTEAISKEKNIQVVLAVLLSAIAVLPHVLASVGRQIIPPQYDFVNIMYRVMPEVSILIVGIVLMLIVLGLFLGDVKIAGTPFGAYGTMIAIVILIAIFALNIFKVDFNKYQVLGRILTPQNQAVLIIMLIFAVIVMWVIHEPNPEKKGWDNFVNVFKEIGGKGK